MQLIILQQGIVIPHFNFLQEAAIDQKYYYFEEKSAIDQTA
jgi:hypothetical protein